MRALALLFARSARCMVLGIVVLSPAGRVWGHGAFHERLGELVSEIERNPQDARLHFELATIFCAHGDWALAVGSADTADELNPGRFPSDLVRGEALLGSGRPDRAKSALDRFIGAYPKHARARILRARAIAAVRGAEAAMADFRAAGRATEQREPDLVREAAAALASGGYRDEAIAILGHAIKEFGAEPGLLLDALELEIAASHWPAALARVWALQQSAPRAEPWMARRAELLARAGRKAEARDAWIAFLRHVEALPNLERGSPPIAALVTRAHGALGASPPLPAAVAADPNPNQPPVLELASPAAGATAIGASINLSAAVSDAEGGAMLMTFYGRKTVPPAPGSDFAIGTLPDTQNYSENVNGRSTLYYAQTQWYADNRDTLNFAFVSHMGDIVQRGDVIANTQASNLPEWQVADRAMKIIEDPVLTQRTHGIPWGGAPGNHDQSPNGSATGTTTFFNQFFGVSRFQGRSYYGGHYGTNNDNNYQLFRASGLDFIIVHFEYDARAPSSYQPVLDWADALLKAHPHRRAIVTSHCIVNRGDPATFSTQGRALYDRLKANPNLFLMLGGHISGEGRRSDSHDGRVVYSVLQDYQSRANGGDGWLRYFVFSPARNTITARTFSPVLNRSETDADSEFTLAYDMQSPVGGWIPIGAVSVPAGGTLATLNWTGLERDSHYEWYAEVRDETNATRAGSRRFATQTGPPPTVELTAPVAAARFNVPATIRLVAAAAAANGPIARVEFYQGDTKLGEATRVPFEFTWSGAISGTYALRAVATDANGSTGSSAVVPITVVNSNNQPPTVVLTSPAADSRVMSPMVTLTAAANDRDGGVTKVEFFAGPTKVGERTTAPFTLTWSSAASGGHVLTARASDNDGGVTTSAPITVSVVQPVTTALISRNAIWRYLDDGSDPGTAWRRMTFDDSLWPSGAAELGYGDGDEATVIGFGPNPASPAVTTYFRHQFAVADPSRTGELALNLLRDDGAIVYLNGVEIGRSGMTTGIDYRSSTLAPTATDGTDERRFFPLVFSIDPAPLLVRGTNTLAVQVHQHSLTNADLSFNLELLDRRFPVRAPPTVALTAPQSGAAFVAPATIPLVAAAADSDGVIINVEFRRNGVTIGEATRAPFAFDWAGATAGVHSVSAVATDNDGNFVESAPVMVAVRDPDPGRFINFSVRSKVGAGTDTLIVGFVTGGEGTAGTKPLLLRAIGPALSAFGVTGFVTDPVASLYRGGTVVAANDNWAGDDEVRATSAQVGAFPLADAASRDAAFISTQPSGAYSLQVSGAGGFALAEIYDAAPGGYTPATPRLINASVRTLVGPGNDILFAGLMVGGATERTVLIRAVGPGLSAFGISNPLGDPRLHLYRDGNDTSIAINDDWGGAAMLMTVFAKVGAFSLPPTSRDAALVVRIPPGVYTAQVHGPAGATGIVLLDIYEVP